MTPSTPLALGPELTISQAAHCHGLLLQSLQTPPTQPLALDLSGVTDFDSAGVQLLLATERSLQQHGQTLQVVRASAVVGGALATLGLQRLLEPATA